MVESISEDENQNPKKAADFESNINTGEVLEMQEQIELAVDYTIGKIRQENPDKRIIFVMDAPRQTIYAGGSLNNSGAFWLYGLMSEVTNKHSVEFIDLSSLMEADYQQNQKPFNSEVDWHWNEYGHQFVAKTLYNHLISDN